MSELEASRRPGGAPTIVHLVGDLDASAQAPLRARLDAALELGEPVVVDIGDCTYAGVETLELLVDASDRARKELLGFVVVLPYSANALLRRVLLEIAPELVTFPSFRRFVPPWPSLRDCPSSHPDLGPRTGESGLYARASGITPRESTIFSRGATSWSWRRGRPSSGSAPRGAPGRALA